EGQTHRDAEVGQFDGKRIGVGDAYRTATLDHFTESQRPAEALVTEVVGSGLDVQRQRLECRGALAQQDCRHVTASGILIIGSCFIDSTSEGESKLRPGVGWITLHRSTGWRSTGRGHGGCKKRHPPY